MTTLKKAKRLKKGKYFDLYLSNTNTGETIDIAKNLPIFFIHESFKRLRLAENDQLHFKIHN